MEGRCSLDLGVSSNPEGLLVDSAGASVAIGLEGHVDIAVNAPVSAPGVGHDEVSLVHVLLSRRATATALHSVGDLLVVAAVAAVVGLRVPLVVAAAGSRLAVSPAAQLAPSHNDRLSLVLVVSSVIDVAVVVVGGVIGVVGLIISSVISVVGLVISGVVVRRDWDIANNGDAVVDRVVGAVSRGQDTRLVGVEARVLTSDSNGHWAELELLDDLVRVVALEIGVHASDWRVG